MSRRRKLASLLRSRRSSRGLDVPQVGQDSSAVPVSVAPLGRSGRLVSIGGRTVEVGFMTPRAAVHLQRWLSSQVKPPDWPKSDPWPCVLVDNPGGAISLFTRSAEGRIEFLMAVLDGVIPGIDLDQPGPSRERVYAIHDDLTIADLADILEATFAA